MSMLFSRFTRIGDRVVFHKRDFKSSSSVPHLTKGTVVGYAECFHHHGRVDSWFTEPGKYRANGGACVLWDNGVVNYPELNEVYFYQPELLEQRMADVQWNTTFDRKARIGNLPELPFYEDDVVELSSTMFQDREGTGRYVVRIQDIRYDDVGKVYGDGTPRPIYTVAALSEDLGTTTVSERAIARLVYRGNHWNWIHNRENLKFAGLHHMVRFFSEIGVKKEVLNPTTNKYLWSLDEAVRAVSDGLGAGIYKILDQVSVFQLPGYPSLERDVRSATLRSLDNNVLIF